jgi:AraC family transcriptional regulator of adaptative response/methylated-DNA-[protein]-cysteine methyltransferase
MNRDYERIATAICFIAAHVEQQPSLDQLAAALRLSPFHLQRLFLRWAGVTPKRFLQFLTVEYAKQLLGQSHSVLDASYAAGLSSPSRLHDHFISLEAVTPGEYKCRGSGLLIRYGVQPSPFGPIFLAVTERGICALAFVTGPTRGDEELIGLQKCWVGARLSEDKLVTGAIARRLFCRDVANPEPLSLLIKGTNFQIQVWKALLRIPPGYLSCYQQIAQAVGRPEATRAVAQAIAANPIAYLIPCHRVIRRIGLPGGYRWGVIRKQALIAWEAGHCAALAIDKRDLHG